MFSGRFATGRNITIRFLGKALGRRATQYLEAQGTLATLFFFTVVTWRVAAFALDETVNNRLTQTLEITTGPWWWFVSGLLLMCVPVQFVIAWVKSSAAITGKPIEYTDNELSI